MQCPNAAADTQASAFTGLHRRCM